MVYPRECGGTRGKYKPRNRGYGPGLSPRVRGNLPLRPRMESEHDTAGLSPRVRGNPAGENVVNAGGPGSGSIPASAGEPERDLPDDNAGAFVRVYPRECGGTPPAELVIGRDLRRVYPRECGGTSASTGVSSNAGLTRSIPASAGEPQLPARRTVRSSNSGLSPRVRGNLRSCVMADSKPLYRSIPASAADRGTYLLNPASGL